MHFLAKVHGTCIPCGYIIKPWFAVTVFHVNTLLRHDSRYLYSMWIHKDTLLSHVSKYCIPWGYITIAWFAVSVFHIDTSLSHGSRYLYYLVAVTITYVPWTLCFISICLYLISADMNSNVKQNANVFVIFYFVFVMSLLLSNNFTLLFLKRCNTMHTITNLKDMVKEETRSVRVVWEFLKFETNYSS